MLCADLCASAGCAFKSADLYKPCGKVALGPLECTACAGIFERLFILPALHQRIHTIFYLFTLAFCQLHFYGCYAKVTLRKKAVSVGKLHFFKRNFLYIAFLGDISAGYDHVLHLAAVSSRIHKNSTADRTGYTVCKLKPRKLVFKSHSTDSRKRCACVALYIFAVYSHRAEITADKQYNSLKPLVTDKDIASPADNIVFNIVLTALLYKLAQQRLAIYLYHNITRSADTERGVIFHRFIFKHDCAVSPGGLLQYAVIVQSILLVNLFFCVLRQINFPL